MNNAVGEQTNLDTLKRTLRNWQPKTIRELAKVVTKGTTPSSLGFSYTKEGINFLRVENISANHRLEGGESLFISEEANTALARSQLKANDILFSIAGAIGRCALVPQSILPANLNQAIAIIRLQNTGEVHPKFLLYYLASDEIQKQALQEAVQLAQSNLNLQQVGDLKILLPPLEQQRKIAAILSSVDDVLEKTQAVIEQNRRFKQTLRNELITKGMLGRHTRSKPFTKRFGFIPENWDIVRLSSVTKKIADMDHKMPPSVSEGVPLISVKDFTTYGIDYSKTKKISTIDYERLSRKCKLERNDLLLTRYGTIGEVRRIETDEPAIASYSIAMIKVDEQKMPSDFLYYLLQSKLFQTQIDLQIVQSAQPDLGIRDLQDMLVPYPPPDEQKKIAEALTSVENTLKARLETQAQLVKLKKSLMQQLLTGRLRVEV